MDLSSMPEILNPRTLFFFAVFIVPGWFARLFYRRYVPDPPEGFGYELVTVISLSLLFFAPSGIALIMLQPYPALVPLVWLPFAVLIVPGVCTYIYLRRIVGDTISITEMLLGKDAKDGAIKPVPPMPTAFDAVFGSANHFLVHFKDESGASRVGYFGPESQTSPFPNEQQLYLQELLPTDKSGNPTGRYPAGSPQRAAGVIIKMAGQSSILVEKLEVETLPEGSDPLELSLGQTRPIAQDRQQPEEEGQ